MNSMEAPGRNPTRVWVAGPADTNDVARLLIAFRDWWGRDQPADERMRHGVEHLIGDGDATFLLAAVGDAPPAGVCQLRFRYGVWYDGLDCELEDLYVDASARGQGLGARLVEATLEHARERGARRVQLDANASNAPAQALYRRYGFTSYSDPPGGEDLLLRLRLERA
jgi:ribosomal protein S18 acetylase RimI-like enzyme